MSEPVVKLNAKGGAPSRRDLYKVVASKSQEAIGVLVEEMHTPSKMGSTRVAAARTILNKALPDLKAMEVTGEEGGALVIKLKTNYETSGLPGTGAVTTETA